MLKWSKEKVLSSMRLLNIMYILSILEIPNKAPCCIVRIAGSLGEDTEPVFLGSVDNVTVTVGR